MSLFIEQQFSPQRELFRHVAADCFLAVRRLLAGWPKAEAMNGGFVKFVPQQPSWLSPAPCTPAMAAAIASALRSTRVTRAKRALLPHNFRWLVLDDEAARRHQKHRAYMHRRSRYLKNHRYPPKAWA